MAAPGLLAFTCQGSTFHQEQHLAPRERLTQPCRSVMCEEIFGIERIHPVGISKFSENAIRCWGGLIQLTD